MISKRFDVKATAVFFMLFGLAMSWGLWAKQSSMEELVVDREAYEFNPKTKIFSLRGQAVSQELQVRLTALLGYRIDDEKIASLNPVSIQNRLYRPFIYYEGNYSQGSNDCVIGKEIFFIQTPQTSFRFKGFVALDDRMQAATRRDLLRDIVEAFFFQYGFLCPNASLGEGSKFRLGRYDLVPGGGTPVSKHDEEFIKDLTEHLLSIIPFAPQIVKEQFQAFLEGGVEYQRYQKILHHLLIVKTMDLEPQLKAKIFDKAIAGDFDAKNYLSDAGAETAAKLEMYGDFIEELKGELVFVKDMVTGDYRVSSKDGKMPSIIWQQELTDFLFSLAEEKAYIEERLGLLKSLLDIAKEYPSAQFKPELLSAVRNVIQEAESLSVDYIVREFYSFLLDKGKEFIANHSQTFIEKTWDSFVLHHTAANSLSQKLFLGAVGKVLLGYAISDRLWGTEAIFEFATRARAEIDFTEQLKEALLVITRPGDKYQRGYFAEDAQHIKTLLIFLGLSRANFHHDMANIAASSSFKTWIVDMWQSFFGQPTMTDAINERRKIAEETEDNFVKYYAHNPDVEEMLESARGRAGQAGEDESGSALALIIDSSGSMSSSDPKNIRVFGGELVFDQADENWVLGVVEFNSAARFIGSGSSEDKQLRQSLRRIGANGGTNIQDGLQKGFDFISSSNKTNRSVILLTDGGHNHPSQEFDYGNYVEIFNREGWPVFTIGLTGDADEVLLSKIASTTGGYYLKAETHQAMVGIIDLILSRFKSEPLLLHQKSEVAQGEIKDFPVLIDPSVIFLGLTGSFPGSEVDFSLIDPDGNIINKTDSSKGIEVIEGEIYTIINVDSPKAGIWKARAEGIEVSGNKEPIEIKISAKTPISIETKGVRAVYNPFVPITFGVEMTGRVDSSTLAWAVQVTSPEGMVESLKLSKAGRVGYRKTVSPGVYYFDISVEGRTLSDEEFQRQILNHIVVAEDSDSGGNITKTWGGYVEIDIGRERGLSEGKRIMVFSLEAGGMTKVAEGFVTAVYQGRSIIELDAGFGSAIPKVGDRVEIDRSER